MKITASMILERWPAEATFLPPLRVRSLQPQDGKGGRDNGDFSLELELPGEPELFRFVVAVRGGGTPLQIRAAVESVIGRVNKIKADGGGDWWPLVVVPYLSPERLEDLERQGVSGVDLCGNGVVIVPRRVCVVRQGLPNLHPETRPVKDPFAGKSALIGRMLLTQPHWSSLTTLVAVINQAGGEISLPQASKVIQALIDELLVHRDASGIRLGEPLRLLDRLGRAFVRPEYQMRRWLRLPQGVDWAATLSAPAGLRWAVSGETAARHYTLLGQGGAWRVAVDDITRALKALGGTAEAVPAFADLELVETRDPAVYFQVVADDVGMRWASQIQCWLELQLGDARQQQAAVELRQQIVKGS